MKKSSKTPARKTNWMSWGDEIVVTFFGMWGQRSNTFTYTFSGQKGHFPDMTYRFTQIGDNSVYKDKFGDFIIDEKDCFIGYKNALFVIDNFVYNEYK